MHAARQVGYETKLLLERPENAGLRFPQTQLAYVDGDTAVYNAEIRELFELVNSGKAMCVYDSVIGHSHLARYDTPDANKFWLDEVTRRSASYLVQARRLTA